MNKDSLYLYFDSKEEIAQPKILEHIVTPYFSSSNPYSLFFRLFDKADSTAILFGKLAVEGTAKGVLFSNEGTAQLDGITTFPVTINCIAVGYLPGIITMEKAENYQIDVYFEEAPNECPIEGVTRKYEVIRDGKNILQIGKMEKNGEWVKGKILPNIQSSN